MTSDEVLRWVFLGFFFYMTLGWFAMGEKSYDQKGCR